MGGGKREEGVKFAAVWLPCLWIHDVNSAEVSMGKLSCDSLVSLAKLLDIECLGWERQSFWPAVVFGLKSCLVCESRLPRC